MGLEGDGGLLKLLVTYHEFIVLNFADLRSVIVLSVSSLLKTIIDNYGKESKLFLSKVFMNENFMLHLKSVNKVISQSIHSFIIYVMESKILVYKDLYKLREMKNNSNHLI